MQYYGFFSSGFVFQSLEVIRLPLVLLDIFIKFLLSFSFIFLFILAGRMKLKFSSQVEA